MLINDEIRDKEVRLIADDGSMVGIVPIKEAQDLAILKNLDLVRIAPQANPPVCRVMDYGKYLFEQSKREKEARKNQKTINIKEIWIKPTIDDNDLNVKVRNANKFLKEGNKVKVTVKFRGRELNYTSLGIKLLDRVAEVLEEEGTVEKRPRLEGKSMTMILNPKQ